MLRACRWSSFPALLALACLLLAGTPAGAAWLLLCDSKEDASDGRRYLAPDGRETSLRVADVPVDRCAQQEIPVSADAVRWTGLIPRDLAMRLDAGVSLLTEKAGDATRVNEIIPAQAAPLPPHASPLTLVLGANMLPQLDLRLFGEPGRARAKREAGGLLLNCTAGTNTAGLLVTARQTVLPVGAKLQVAVHYSASTAFPFAFSDADQLAREAPVRLGILAADSVEADAAYKLPPVVAAEPHGFSFFCPGTEARLQLKSLELRAGVAAEQNQRATWVWRGDEALAEPDIFLRTLQAQAIRTLFLAVPLTGEPPAVAEPDALALLIEQARELGIETWAVEGDPAAVTRQGREHFLQRTRALAAFNASQSESRRLRGVQYDIEPYLLPGFELRRDAWLQAYLDTLRTLRNEWSVPMEAAVPFWWAGLTVNDEPLLMAMHPLVDGLTVMNYRTDLEQLQRLAEPYLAWGARRQRYVRIALESVALPDQLLTHFRRGRTGRLWQLRLGDTHALVLLAMPGANPVGPSFGRAYATVVPASGTTFRGRRHELAQKLPTLVRHWSAWPSFAGPALHGYLESYD